MRDPDRNQRGFSLPEVLAALLIVTFVITVSFTAFLERNRRLEQASEIMLVYQALANEAEHRRRIPYSLVMNDKEFLSDYKQLLAPLNPDDVDVVVEEGEPGIKYVTMSVSWRNGERVARLTLIRVHTGGTRLW